MSNTTNPPPIPQWFTKWISEWMHKMECQGVDPNVREGLRAELNWVYEKLSVSSPTGESAGRWEWIELKTGCEMPEIDEFVLWKREDGNYFVREIDKDDNAWWKGDAEADELFGTRSKCTHWAKIQGPSHSPTKPTEGQ